MECINGCHITIAGREKLNVHGECHVFDESDGTEIDNNECLSAYEKRSGI